MFFFSFCFVLFSIIYLRLETGVAGNPQTPLHVKVLAMLPLTMTFESDTISSKNKIIVKVDSG